MSSELKTMIKWAFSKSKYPDDENIVYDNSGNHLECNDIRDDFQGKLWQKVSQDTLLYNRGSLSFFSDSGYRYYLPAYMIFVLDNLKKADTIPDEIITSLTPLWRDMDIKKFNKRMNGFSKEQKKIIKLFLEFLDKKLEESSARKALRKYWSQV